MMRWLRLKRIIPFSITFMILSISVISISAQELCEVLVREAWENVKNNCASTEGDSACYGNDSLVATFNGASAAAALAQPSDVLGLTDLHTVETVPFSEQDEEWGISHFQVSASYFGGAEDQYLLVYTAGNVVVENASVPETDEAPLQQLNFTTSGPSDCREAPNAVFIQSPQGLEVNLTVNSTPIQLHSTIVMGIDKDASGLDVMWLGVVEGSATLFAGTSQEQIIPSGNYTTTRLSDEEGKGLNGETILNTLTVPVLDTLTGQPVLNADGEPFYRQAPVEDFSPPQPITLDGEGFTGWGAYSFLNLVPGELLNYPVRVPEPVTSTTVDSGGSTVSITPTQDPTRNWCYPGGPWGDGRCNDPDPAIRDWYWNAGWYNAALANGLISEIPPQYAGGPLFDAAFTSCVIDVNSTMTVAGVPSGTNYILLYYATGDIGYLAYSGQSTFSVPFSSSDLAYLPIVRISAAQGSIGSLVPLATDTSLGNMPPCTQ